MSSTAFGIVLGILVGLRHAFEPDHLTAVSTLVSETHNPKHGALLGALWGLGHTISLVVVGAILMVVGATLPERAALLFELGVAGMLLVLGARAIAVAARVLDRRDAHGHAHGPGTHTHAFLHLDGERAHGASSPLRRPRARMRLRPLFVGLVHGLAGSGALTALVFAQLPDAGARMLYMVLFGAGSVAGMAIASGLAGAALQHLARSVRVRRRIGIATGALTIVVGVIWGVPLIVQLVS